MRGGGTPASYGQKRRRTASDRLMGRVRGSDQFFCRRSNGDGDGKINGFNGNDGMGMGGSSCDASNRSGSRPGCPRSTVRKSYRGTAAPGSLTTRSRYGSMSGSVSRWCCRRLRGGGVLDLGEAAVAAAMTGMGIVTTVGTLGVLGFLY